MFKIRNEFLRLLLILSVAHIIPIIVYITAYILADFQNTGDTFGGLMMIYGIGFFIPNFILFIFILFYILKLFLKNIKSFSRVEKLLIILYYSTLLFSMYEVIYLISFFVLFILVIKIKYFFET